MTRTLLLIIIFTSFGTFSIGQTDEEKQKIDTAVDNAINAYLKNPTKFKKYLDPAIIKQFPDSGRIENSLKEGQWIEYSLDTIIAENSTLTVGNNTLPMRNSYFLKKDVGNYIKGILTGTWTLYECFATEAPFDFEMRDVRFYKNGKLNGKEIYYQGYGIYRTPLAICNWKDGVKDGIGEEYDYNYPFNRILLYKISNGKTVLQQSFYPNGKVETEQTYSIENGKEIIFAKHYFQNGQLDYTGYFLDDHPYKIWTVYYENEKIKSIDNKTNGNYKFYFDTGQLCTERIYKSEKLMEVISNFTKAGKKNNPGTIKNGTGTLNLYDPDGKLTETLHYIDGLEKK